MLGRYNLGSENPTMATMRRRAEAAAKKAKHESRPRPAAIVGQQSAPRPRPQPRIDEKRQAVIDLVQGVVVPYLISIGKTDADAAALGKIIINLAGKDARSHRNQIGKKLSKAGLTQAQVSEVFAILDGQQIVTSGSPVQTQDTNPTGADVGVTHSEPQSEPQADNAGSTVVTQYYDDQTYDVGTITSDGGVAVDVENALIPNDLGPEEGMVVTPEKPVVATVAAQGGAGKLVIAALAAAAGFLMLK